jgi:hypothetical protein
MKRKKKKVENSNIKTVCCNADWYIKSRGNYRCEKCDDDVTLHIVLAQMASEESENK